MAAKSPYNSHGMTASGRGDGPDRYSEFVREYSRSYHRLYSFVLSLVGNVHEADDLMQETGILLWQKFDDYASGTSFLRWARAVARNLVYRYYRSKKQGCFSFDTEVMAKLAAAHVSAEEWLEVRREILADCVEKLPLAERKLIERCYAEQGSIKSTAEEMNKSQNAISKRLSRIRIKLSRCVERTLGMAQH
ncbi:ECF RNA polymerase sigma factor SigW [Maioricimonas rarisocia]|uniref:ECF RNA polymerase sigma factor SigW n=1 Tax=Maioricimonas rarisocia TaxID=2528026 RepID=A0A517Z6G7_9PLAN|nr:sigma-70 family RNA polymerase sigma factor [Maioricimonas rarisocia]QDU38011.1 ECF RNA polymerase sigma factor SigW [Maioricimonas rarisocia]